MNHIVKRCIQKYKLANFNFSSGIRVSENVKYRNTGGGKLAF
jgi:hypothetical protein